METLAAKGMAGNFVSPTVRLIDNGIDFFGRERRRNYHLAIFVESELVGSVQLDPISAFSNLLADGFTGGPGRIHHLQRRRRDLPRVAVHDEATGSLKATGRNLHAWAFNHASINRVT